ncbi:aspartate aminotransferase family protein [Serratia sp. JSRIV001]|uniref:pyridoxal phosphate-dependent decarboxylase family protein n=1 Tax=unclassified Serratia (in: enterobacteria) TaxID=2647522 RepID=UPI001CC027DE|nr:MULTISPECIES: aminotransferase class V-fold PLP-dependent enzyme [unclassified Serratia (in: enterobacteria)]UAN43931.1 aspartate aminotransferase family protein [Serratia sp. JSRIV001]UAN53557.1 aspartate aminotransferase family protein [Serratia sp. JSRIV002]UAN58178.1 aspartate aminotransferase family protein [Serratia sp. JSRIV004]
MLSKANAEILFDFQCKLRGMYKDLPSFEQGWKEDTSKIMEELLLKLVNNDPFYHPHYLGHMSGYICDISVMSYFLTMQINPNNHSYDGGRATTEMEVECMNSMANMIGWESYHGHLTSGGTSGNLEALWFHKENGAKTIIFSSNAHYTHKRMARLLGMDYIELASDHCGRMDIRHLTKVLTTLPTPSPVIVCTLGTTLMGALDPLHDILELRKNHSFIIHVDAAYGGYFYLIRNSLSYVNKIIYDSLPKADSVVIDPHKHGLQGFGCGAVLFNKGRQSEIENAYRHDSPYTYFDRRGKNIGETSLECSRPGAAAAALWATMNYLPLIENGEFADALMSCHITAKKIAKRLDESGLFKLLTPDPDLDIVVFYIDCINITASTEKLYDRLRLIGFYVALAQCDIVSHAGTLSSEKCIRMTLMKKEHSDVCDLLIENIISIGEEIIRGI